MAEIRTQVTFQTPAFNSSESKDHFINDGCYGDDVARALMEVLRSKGYKTDTEPGQEDFGWYFGFRSGETNYQFFIGHRPADADDPAVWIGWIERQAGIIGSLFGAGKRSLQPDAVRAIHEAIAALPQVTDIRWHRKEDFDKGREELGQSHPISE